MTSPLPAQVKHAPPQMLLFPDRGVKLGYDRFGTIDRLIVCCEIYVDLGICCFLSVIY